MPAVTANSDVNVNVLLDTPALARKEFGTLLLVFATGLAVGFTERLRTYSSAADAEADADLPSNAKTAIAMVFGQTLKPSKLLVGRADQMAAGVYTVTITAEGDDGDTHTVTVLGTEFSHAKTIGQSVGDVATAIKALIDAGSEPVTVGVAAGVLTITGTNKGQALGVTYAGSGNAAGTAVETTETVDMGDELTAIKAVDDSWFGVHLASRDAWNIEAAAAWCEANGALQVAQSSDADLLTTATDDIASTLKAAGRKNTALLYYADDTVWAALAWATNRLSVDPDQRATTWNKITLVDIAATALASTTELANLKGKNANAYIPFFSTTGTVDGKTAAGNWIDEVVSREWTRARVREVVAALLLRYANLGRKIPYTDAGIQAISDAVLTQLQRGEEAGHFIDGTSQTFPPKRADLSSEVIASRALAMNFSADLAGAIHSTTLAGYLTYDGTAVQVILTT